MIEFYITAFVTLFLIIDPIGLIPVFVSLTQGNQPMRRSFAIRACLVAFGILAVFALVGENLLDFIGIGMPAFRISGGLLLFLTAVDMLFSKRTERREEKGEIELSDPSVFPLGTPLIAGPGSMAAMILLVGQPSDEFSPLLISLLAMTSVIVLSFLGFMTSNVFERALGKTGIEVITRLMGMLLAALSVQFVVDGLKGLGAL